MERDPVRFLATELEAGLDRARGVLAGLIGADPDDLAFLPNATAGVNTVLRSIAPRLAPADEVLTTDHEYNATRNALDWLASASGARIVTCQLPFPISSPEEAVASILGALTARTRLAVISHVTSATALVLPIERIVAELRDRGVDTLVDGAHAPGMVPLDLRSIGAAYTCGNGHKWLCGPKGSGFLHVRRDHQPDVRPLAISHGANDPRRSRSRFRLEFDWTGTADPTPYLALAEAIRFMASTHDEGWAGVMASNRELAIRARNLLCAALGIDPPAPDSMLGSMAAIPLPADLSPGPADALALEAAEGESLPPDPLHDWLLERGIQVPVYPFPLVVQRKRPPMRLLRVSAQRYNKLADYEQLAAALADARAAA